MSSNDADAALARPEVAGMAMLWILFRRFDAVFLYRRSVLLIQVMNHLARAAEQNDRHRTGKSPAPISR
jgi:hypothetical protein